MSTSFNTSSSSSNPIQTPENNISNSISNVASGLAQQMLGWAQGVFSQVQGVTSQAVGNFFQTSAQMLGLSGQIVNQYENQFAPEDTQLLEDANSYNSAARQGVDMGQAGATQGQADDAARHNSEAQLQSFGINPADGRYAALDKAAAVQNAANVAGAENMQRNADVTTGQNLRSEAVQVGAQLPAAAANIAATANNANAAAANAKDAAANTGRNLMSLPNDYLNTASHIMPPFNGQQSSSFGNSVSQPKPPTPNGNGNQGNGNGSQGNGHTPNSPSNMNPNLYTQPSQSGNPSMRGQPGDKVLNIPQQDTTGGNDWQNAIDPALQMNQDVNSIEPNTFNGQDPNNIYQPQDGFGMSAGPQTTDAIDTQNPFNDSGFGQTYDQGANQTFGDMSGGTDTQYGNISYDPSANQTSDYSNFGDYSQVQQNDPAFDSGSSTDYSNAGSFDNGSGDSSSMDYSDFARGGAVLGRGQGPTLAAPTVLNRAGGGGVPAGASPSQGQTVDDVPANLNAGEFVIPRDVALWKGQEFFQKLIDQARARNGQASAKPTPGGPQPPTPGMQ